ncbi:hypothetical protein [Pseudomonas syringae]|uniref:hypothetical protein n=1 Tax=Pseudomonas syringae TaxID=317 RepID=UPI000CDACD1E|nr:hypothetical protein [Pseudomonas syringae]POR63931.1 hypothetical protein BKM10_15575 [Pseudomonas syringae pv. syringae]POR68828.1 hypothetical protein BKM27_17615 [Pseudomonas syringae pv. syringae]POR76946.1 hypothetical protein BKM30_17070 [Pseudomonas syringae pv. syringae]
MKIASLAFLCFTALATQAQASSSDAWAAYDKAVLESCIKASGLKDAQPVGTPAQFDDRVGYTALLMQGQYPQKHMNGRQGTELCLFNSKSKAAFVTEWDSIRTTGKTQ